MCKTAAVSSACNRRPFKCVYKSVLKIDLCNVAALNHRPEEAASPVKTGRQSENVIPSETIMKVGALGFCFLSGAQFSKHSDALAVAFTCS